MPGALRARRSLWPGLTPRAPPAPCSTPARDRSRPETARQRPGAEIVQKGLLPVAARFFFQLRPPSVCLAIVVTSCHKHSEQEERKSSEKSQISLRIA